MCVNNIENLTIAHVKAYVSNSASIYTRLTGKTLSRTHKRAPSEKTNNMAASRHERKSRPNLAFRPAPPLANLYIQTHFTRHCWPNSTTLLSCTHFYDTCQSRGTTNLGVGFGWLARALVLISSAHALCLARLTRGPHGALRFCFRHGISKVFYCIPDGRAAAVSSLC